MSNELRILSLHLGGSVVSHFQDELQKAGFSVTCRTTTSYEAFLKEMEGDPAQLALIEAATPEAVQLARDLHEKWPASALMFVGGHTGEARVADLLKNGADDYLLTDQVNHVGDAARRALERARDRGHQRQMQKKLRESEERYALALQGSNDGIYDWDIRGNRVYYSDRWKAIIGYQPHEIASGIDEWFSRIHPDDQAHVKMRLDIHVQGLTPNLEAECHMRHKNGHYVSVLIRGLAVCDSNGRPYRLAGSMTDITDRKRAEEQMAQAAFYDTQTNLPNRALFMDRLGRTLRILARRRESTFALLLLDLDRFKLINESLGHARGDEMLKEVGERLSGIVRAGDTVARLGGDEFAILLEDLGDPEQAMRMAERTADRILREIRKPFSLADNPVVTSASIGLLLGRPEYERPEDMLRDADAALYRAKSMGRDRAEMFEQALHTTALSILRTEVELRRSIDRKEFVVYFQPIVSLKTGTITGAEALVRWQHPQRGIVPPAEFIPLAEETGAIVQIGENVLRSATAQLRAWLDDGYPPLTLAVNLSARQFQQRNLRDMIARAINDAGVSPSRVKLELTESAVMQDPDAAATILNELGRLGLRFSLDDFGTGYSSLAHLKKFPINTLKIDRSFVKDVTGDPDAASIATAIVRMAHSLKMDVVAEGIETHDQKSFLSQVECDEGQGYLFSKPIPADAFQKMLTKNGNGAH